MYGGEDDEDYDQETAKQPNGAAGNNEEGGDLINYKGIYYNDD